jgi:hypothetical protein
MLKAGPTMLWKRIAYETVALAEEVVLKRLQKQLWIENVGD